MASPRERAWGTIVHRTERGGLYYVLFRHGGRRYKRAAGSTWVSADKKLRETRVALERGHPIEDVLAHVFGDAVRVTFREATPLYLADAATRKKDSTLTRDTKRLRLIARAAWAGKVLAGIERADLERWLDGRRKPHEEQRDRKPRRGETPEAYEAAKDRTYTFKSRGASPATLNRDLSLVSAVFRWAVRTGRARENPARQVERRSEKGRAREAYLTAGECHALLTDAPPVLVPLLTAAIHTGMRKGELLALRWRAVDLERRELLVEPQTEKIGRGRVVPLTAELHALLTAQQAQRVKPALDRSDHVFAHLDGDPFTEANLRVIFDPLVVRCEGIPLSKRASVTFHTLRHTAASLMVSKGVSLFDVGGILRHRHHTTTLRYAHFAPETAGRAAIARLSAALNAPAPKPSRARARAST